MEDLVARLERVNLQISSLDASDEQDAKGRCFFFCAWLEDLKPFLSKQT
jgi:hypothetical protein